MQAAGCQTTRPFTAAPFCLPPAHCGTRFTQRSPSFPFHRSPEKASNQPDVTQHRSPVPATLGVGGAREDAPRPGTVLATLLTRISSDPDGSLGGRPCELCDTEENARRLGAETQAETLAFDSRVLVLHPEHTPSPAPQLGLTAMLTGSSPCPREAYTDHLPPFLSSLGFFVLIYGQQAESEMMKARN